MIYIIRALTALACLIEGIAERLREYAIQVEEVRREKAEVEDLRRASKADQAVRDAEARHRAELNKLNAKDFDQHRKLVARRAKSDERIRNITLS